MPETAARKVARRSEGHSDVADSAPFRQHVENMVEGEFGRALLTELRGAKAPLVIRNLNEEWLKSGAGMIYEISADLAPAE